MPSILPYLTAMIRWGLGLAAGYLVAHGILTESQGSQVIDIALSAALALVPILWSFWQKHKQAQHLTTAAETGEKPSPAL